MKQVGSLVREAKCQKLNTNGDVDSTQELNGLPDAIILHILSFLPTRDAMKTSVLSKRWEFLWPCMSKLEFHDNARNKTSSARFLNIIDRGFAFRDSSSIDTLSIQFTPKDDVTDYRLRYGIAAAVRHKVQKLFINCCLNRVPSCLYMCETLNELHLHLHMPLPRFSPSNCLWNLKVLHLSIRNTMDGISLQELFSLASLEELIFFCRFKDNKAISIIAPKLRKLSINDFSLRTDISTGYKVLIDGSSLQSFEYYGHLFYDLCISAAYVLVRATVVIPARYRFEEQLSKRLHKFLIGLSNARFFTLCSEALSERSQIIDGCPLFSNIKVLKFESQCFIFDCQVLVAILTRFPCLESLQFDKGIKLVALHIKYNWTLDPVPPCFLSQLKRITIREFEYDDMEMIVVSILLGAARVLKEMVIHGSYSFGKKQTKVEKVIKALKALPRESEDCSFIVHSK